MNKLAVIAVLTSVLALAGCQNGGTNSSGALDALRETGERSGANPDAIGAPQGAGPQGTGAQVANEPAEFDFTQRIGYQVRPTDAVVDAIYGWSVANGDADIEPNHLLDSELRLRVDEDEDFDLYIRYRPGEDNIFVLTAGGSQDDEVPKGVPADDLIYTGKSLIVYSDDTVESGTLTATFDFSKKTGDIRGETENSEFEMFVRIEDDSENLSLIDGWLENSKDERQSLLMRGMFHNSGFEGLSGVFNAKDNSAAGAYIGSKNKEPQLRILKESTNENTADLELYASFGRRFQANVAGEEVSLTGYALGNVANVFSLQYREATEFTAENGWQKGTDNVGDGRDIILQMRSFSNEESNAYIMSTSGTVAEFSDGLPSGQFIYGNESMTYFFDDNGEIVARDKSVIGRVNFESRAVDVIIETGTFRFNALNMDLTDAGYFETETGEFRRHEDSEWITIDPNAANLEGRLHGTGEGMSGVYYSDGTERGIAGLFAATQNK